MAMQSLSARLLVYYYRTGSSAGARAELNPIGRSRCGWAASLNRAYFLLHEESAVSDRGRLGMRELGELESNIQ